MVLMNLISSLRRWALSGLALITRNFHPRGTERLLRLLHHPDRRGRYSVRTTLAYGDGLKIQIDTASFIEWSIFFKGSHEPGVRKFMKTALRPGSVCFDVGANIGAHALAMAVYAAIPFGRVVAIEPNPEIFGRLSQNFILNKKAEGATLLACGLSDKAGETLLHLPASGDPNLGQASLYAAHISSSSRSVKISIKLLDDVVRELGLARVDFIKIDTEGNDFKVIKGGRRILEQFRPIIVFEYEKDSWQAAGFSLGDAQSFFKELGYRLLTLNTQGRPVPLTASNFQTVVALP